MINCLKTKFSYPWIVMSMVSVFVFVFNWSTALLADGATGQVSVHVELSPVGSFDLKSEEVIGQGAKTGADFYAKELKVPVKSLKSGITLRDNHTHEKLQAEKYPFILVSDIVAKGEKSGNGTAKLKVMDITKPIAFTYKVDGPDKATATFEINLTEFSIEGISYKGVGVEDVVQVSATIPYSAGTKSPTAVAPKAAETTKSTNIEKAANIKKSTQKASGARKSVPQKKKSK